jgi:UDP-arabinose 4-epimerase
MLRGPTILVTGGAGYVGAHTCKALSQAGFLPVVYDNLSTGHAAFVKWGPLVQADIRDSEAVAQAIKRHDVKGVLHFAASAYVGESVTAPTKYYNNNVAGTLSLLRGMMEAECSKLIFSSTCAIYGNPDEVPIRETAHAFPVNPYGASKLMVERILADYRNAYGLNSFCLRYFNACGADQDGEIGELRDPETHLIPRAMMALQGYINDFAVFGTDFDTPDGTAIRDYVHVADLAEAHVTALQLLLRDHRGGAFNLGTGRGYSVREILDAITSESGENFPTVYGPRRPGDPPALVANPTVARHELGFDPSLSDLPTIIRTAWAWHQRAHPRCSQPKEKERLIAGTNRGEHREHLAEFESFT